MKVIIVEDVTREDLPFLFGKINTEEVVGLVQVEPAKETPKQEEARAEKTKQDKPAKEEKSRQHKSEEKASVEKVKAEKSAAEPLKVFKEEKAEKKEEPKQEEPKATEKKEVTPQVSRTDVINLGKKLVKEGHGKDVSKLMKDTYNATKFSDISDDQLPEVYKAFKEIEDAA